MTNGRIDTNEPARVQPDPDFRAEGQGACSPRRARLFPLLLILLVGLAYSNSFNGAFVLDGRQEILKNPDIRSFEGWSESRWLMPRSLTDFTFAVNFATGGENPADYHATNLLIHISCALLLYGLISRTLLIPGVGGACANSAPWVAFFSAAIWAVHPLGTSSVTYIWQRSESLAGMLLLSTLYSIVRSHSSSRPLCWHFAAVLFCALGMAAKEVMITAPVVALAFDRLLLARSFKEVVSKRWHLHLGLVLSWVLLALMMARKVASAEGFGSVYTSGASISYLLTQSRVIAHYCRLALWPSSLCLDYGWPLTEEIGQAWPYLALLVLVGAGVLASLRRFPVVGFLGLVFFVVLSPTSSFAPRPDNAFEHRMYIPLAAVVTLAVGCACQFVGKVRDEHRRVTWSRLLVSAGMLVVICLAVLTSVRNRDYVSEEAMWKDIVSKRPDNLRARNNLAAVLCEKGDIGEALIHFRHVLQKTDHLKPDQFREKNRSPYEMPSNSPQNCRVSALANFGFLAFQQGDKEKAIGCYAEALRLFPYSDIIARKLRYALRSEGVKDDELEQAMRRSIESAGFDEAWLLTP